MYEMTNKRVVGIRTNNGDYPDGLYLIRDIDSSGVATLVKLKVTDELYDMDGETLIDHEILNAGEVYHE